MGVAVKLFAMDVNQLLTGSFYIKAVQMKDHVQTLSSRASL